MRRNRMDMKLEIGIYMLSGLGGIIVYIFLYGFRVLNPSYVDWLLAGGDLSQHYLGWEFYRRSEWFFPFGLTDRLAYPDKTSVIFTDSIPLFAVFFKMIRRVLPENFQYFGWWGILCFYLQGHWSAKILRELKVPQSSCIFGSLFFTTAPVFLYRMYMHTSLAGQWIILISIYLYVRHDKDYNQVRLTSIQWGILGFLIPAVHIYFLPICGIFVLMYVIMSCISNRRVKISYIAPMLSYLTMILLNTWLLGGFSSRARTGAAGLGEFSFNLNGFINPQGYSSILKDLPQYNVCQSEGMAYLGMGMLILIAFAIIGFIKSRCMFRWDYFTIAIIMILFAASPTITFGEKVLINILYSEKILHYWEMFRSSGREIWGIYYLLMIYAVVGIQKCFSFEGKKNRKFTIGVMILCAIIQIFDLSKVLISKHDFYRNEKVYNSEMYADIWKQISQRDYKHLVYAQEGIDLASIFKLAEYARENDMTMSNYYFARNIERDLNIEVQLSHPNEESIYVVLGEKKDEMENYRELYWYEADGFTVGVKTLLEK